MLPAYSCITVLCPALIETGGTELLHQLVSALTLYGANARLVYTPVGQAARTPTAYQSYGCPISTVILDEPEAAVVIPETMPSSLDAIKYAQIHVWWMSVDNFFYGVSSGESLRIDIAATRSLMLLRILSRGENIVHLYQSEYARLFLQRVHAKNLKPMSDYISFNAGGILPPAHNRQIAYNPKKGKKYTSRILAAYKDSYDFVPLQNMSRAEIIKTLQASTIYIDFGGHPGKDRIPREAALCHAVVVVGLRGSAKNAVDVPIPSRYKVKCDKNFVARVGAAFESIFVEPSLALKDQESYRRIISEEGIEFKNNIEDAFFTPVGQAVDLGSGPINGNGLP